MTERLYYEDCYLREFRGRIVQAGEGGTRVYLDRSAFYPTSGGQPFDTGMLGGARVIDVIDEEEHIVHVVDAPLSEGEIAAEIDWPRRFDHMQQHTGQHLLSAMFDERFGLQTVSFHLGQELCTIDLRGPEPGLALLQGAQRAANTIIFEDRPINVRYGTSDQLASIGVRKQLEREGIIRAIDIEAADLQPCGGTHVKSTGQIGMILVRRCTKMRRDWRVEFACGSRADRVATADFQVLRTISGDLGCSPEEAILAIERSSTEREENFKHLREALQRLAVARATLLVAATPPNSNGVRVVTESLRDAHPELLLPLATEIAKHERAIALVALEETGQLAFAQHPTGGKDLAAIVKQLFLTHPGKGGGTRDFVRAKLTSPSDSEQALATAKSMVQA
jgi:alanyl-tRNA synthetase